MKSTDGTEDIPWKKWDKTSQIIIQTLFTLEGVKPPHIVTWGWFVAFRAEMLIKADAEHQLVTHCVQHKHPVLMETRDYFELISQMQAWTCFSLLHHAKRIPSWVEAEARAYVKKERPDVFERRKREEPVMPGESIGE